MKRERNGHSHAPCLSNLTRRVIERTWPKSLNAYRDYGGEMNRMPWEEDGYSKLRQLMNFQVNGLQ